MTRPDSKACVSRSDRAATRLARPAAVRPPLIGAGQVFVVLERPSPHKVHPRRESNEESPGSQWLLGAVWGAQPQRTPRGKHRKANMFTQKRAYTPPPTPFSAFPRPFVLRRDRRQKTRNLEVNQQSRITARRLRTHEWRSRPTAEQERNITQAVLFGAQAANSRREPNARHSERNA